MRVLVLVSTTKIWYRSISTDFSFGPVTPIAYLDYFFLLVPDRIMQTLIRVQLQSNGEKKKKHKVS